MGRQYVSARSLLLAALVFISVAGGIGVIFPPHIYPLAVVVGLIALGLMIYSPISALVLYLVFFLAWPQEWAPYFNHLPPFTERIIGFMAIGSMLISFIMKQRSKFYLGRVGFGLVAFIAALCLTVFTAYWLTEVKNTLVDMLRFLTVFVLIVQICETPKKLKAVVLLYFILTGIMATLSVVNYYNGIFQYTMGIQRALGHGLSYADPNSHAANLAYCLPVMLYYLKETKGKWDRALIILIGLICVWNIVLTGSRTSMIGTLFLAGVVVVRSKRRLAYGFLAIIMLLLLINIMPGQYKDRFMTATEVVTDEGPDQSAKGRIEGLRDGFLLFLKSPITGVGAGCYKVARGEEFGEWVSSHFMLGELIADGGIIGIGTFVFFIYAMFWSIGQARRYLKNRRTSSDNRFLMGLVEGILVSLWILFLQGMGTHNLYRFNWYFFAALVAVAHRLTVIAQTAEETDEADPPPEKLAIQESSGP
ncbi:MAG: O-antigen ligase family protein [candidate division Zixibacteria bacterium]|nr:O-antigen ligase family protein [candidate division Zixibacteria bacterium]MDH3936027.1 O-antigen ligase family protein [candidate division Zixibacteria bacterium]MDH4033168.1 O-antigen ligase family protein [candidate division Zixibacteria bacterium]